MIGRSPAFVTATRLINKLAACDATLLIEGETGTGKELAARAVHDQGARGGKPFISVNCGALPDLLIENELFGHERGAYTDARVDSPGLLSIANGGTLFLDEIDSLSPKAQVILLRVLQDQRYRPLGGSREQSVDVRIIAASNRHLQSLARAGVFREDLLFRINLLYLELPPLRNRHGDPEILANAFIRRYSERYAKSANILSSPSKLGAPGSAPPNQKIISKDTLAWFNDYHWPGNVRELENLVHREFLTTDSDTLFIACPKAASANTIAAMPIGDLDAANGKMPVYSQAIHTNADAAYTLAKEMVLQKFSECYLHQLMQRTRGNVSEAARHAGKERRALGRLLKKYGIAPAEFRI